MTGAGKVIYDFRLPICDFRLPIYDLVGIGGESKEKIKYKNENRKNTM